MEQEVRFLSVNEFKNEMNLQSLTVIKDNVKGTLFAKSNPEVENLLVKQSIDLSQKLIVVAFNGGNYCIVNGSDNDRFEELSL